MCQEIKILNRTIRWCDGKLEYEADSRHAEAIIEECEVQSGRITKTPGILRIMRRTMQRRSRR